MPALDYPRETAARPAAAPRPAPCALDGADAAPAWGVAGFAWRLAAVAGGIAATLAAYRVLLGQPVAFEAGFAQRYAAYGAVFLLAALLGRWRREAGMALAALPCLHALWDACPPLVPYALVLVPTLYRLLGPEDRPGPAAARRFWWGVGAGIVLLPKIVQVLFLRNAHGSFLDANQAFFAGLFLRYAYYYYERRRGLVPAGRFWEHAAYLLFVPQISGTLNVPPGEMRARWGFGARSLGRGWASVGWAALKIPAILWLERAVLPAWGYGRGYGALRAAPLGQVWVCLLASYLYWALLVSAKFDLMAALFRFFGVDVEDNFRWPLLATSPLALWRRWNVYNRRLLLKFVYFPLGGGRAHVYRNILATFLASALLLHTGYLGSPWWGLNPWQLRDWLLYFAGQGLLVCAAHWWLNRPFWERVPPAAGAALRALGWAFTLGSSAWLHVLPLAAGGFLNAPDAPLPALGQRLGLMARALGWPAP